MSFVKLQVLGNIGKDAEIREVNGRFAINFSIAHNRRWTDSDGIKRESTTWFSCAIWKDSREKTKIAEYLKSGQIVMVEGTPELRTFKNKDGVTIAAINVNVSDVHFAGSAQKTAGQPAEKAAEPVYDSYPEFNGDPFDDKKPSKSKKDPF